MARSHPTPRQVGDPTLSLDLVERVLAKLGLAAPPSLDLPGLNALCAAYCSTVSFDNIQKRIWFAGDQTKPLTGGDPTEFFKNWLTHGTGGTCWPINGALYALVRSLEFEARRIAGSMVVQGYPRGANHGSVLVTLDETDYLVDGNIGAFKALPLVPNTPASTGQGIHDIRAAPIEGGFEVLWYTGTNRAAPVPFRPEPERDPVDHAFFLARYDRSKKVGFFNDALYICRRFPEAIVTLGRGTKLTVAADNSVSKAEIKDEERGRILVEELGVSAEIADALPPDLPGGAALV
jgi:arylamine N-acetyltransferase